MLQVVFEYLLKVNIYLWQDASWPLVPGSLLPTNNHVVLLILKILLDLYFIQLKTNLL